MMLINVKMPKALKKRHGFKVAADEEPHSYVGEDDEDDEDSDKDEEEIIYDESESI